MKLSAAVLCILGAASIAPAYGWGVVGHEVVATIAQMYLHPKVMPILCDILNMPPHNCHLAPLATWADRNRMRMRWSASLHYVGAIDDHPVQSCAFPGDSKWAGHERINVLDGIRNTTSLLQSWVEREVSDSTANEALKFLIHFVGDLHQPLHLTGRDRGGNGIKVLFDRKHTNLHSVWDTLLIAKAVRTVPHNYTRPLPYRSVERALRGTIYDAYIRRIIHEGILQPWKDDLSIWLTCPALPEASPADKNLGVESVGRTSGLVKTWHSVASVTRNSAQTVWDIFGSRTGVDILPDDATVCPYFWAQPNHKLNCEIIWLKQFDEDPYRVTSRASFPFTEKQPQYDELSPHFAFNFDEGDLPDLSKIDSKLLQLDIPEYAGEIARRMIIEKLLAQGGIRLAGLLNYIFASTDEGLYVRNIGR